MKKWIMVIASLVILSTIIIIFLINKQNESVISKTWEVQKGNIESVVSGKGILSAIKEQKEYSTITSKVLDIYYLEGDNVEIGYPIIKLDSSDIENKIKEQEIAIKQSELLKKDIEKRINDLKIIASNDGYINKIEIAEGSFVEETETVCNILKENKFEAVFQFVYYENNPIKVGTVANINLTESFSTIKGVVTKVSDMRKLIEGNAQVIDVTIEVETSGYSLDGATARAELSNGVTMIQSTNIVKFCRVNSNVIVAKTSGTVKEIYVTEGKKVKKGEIIAILENPNLETKIIEANLKLENLYNQLNILKEKLEDYLISAKIKGNIIMQDVKIGDYIEVGEFLTNIVNKDMMKFVIPINELDVAKIDYGKEVIVTIDALSETKINPLIGKIIDIPNEGVFKDGVTYYYVTIRVPSSEKMKISMNANANIVLESKKDVIYVPIEYVIEENGKEYVDVLLPDGITIERRNVEIGINDSVNVEIKSGLEKGEKVIIK